jgi:hypothetical protein
MGTSGAINTATGRVDNAMMPDVFVASSSYTIGGTPYFSTKSSWTR